MGTRKIVIVGGSAAGAKAAAKARRLDQKAEITIVQKDPDLSMASCGYPYYVGGLFDNRNMLLATPTGVVRNPGFFKKAKDINALTSTEVIQIDRNNKTITTRNLEEDTQQQVPYDKLVLCTGAKVSPLPLSGIDLEGITTFLSMADTDYLKSVIVDKSVDRAVVIGGGLIGVETCEALKNAGVEVELVEMEDTILSYLDPQLASLTAKHMEDKGVTVHTSTRVSGFVGEGGKLAGVKLEDETILYCKLAVIATGVRPRTELAQDAGLQIGELGGIVVDEYMATSDPDIYAAGDCVEIRNYLTGKSILCPMGDAANLQGRVVGENIILGNSVSYPGVIQSSICKVFDFGVGSTGITEETAQENGFPEVESAVNASPDKPGFMGAKLLISKIVVDKKTLRILGYQCVGNGDVSRQVSTMAMAVQAGMTLPQLTCADLPYAPPYSLAIDHCIASAHIVENKIKGRFKSITPQEVYVNLQEKTKTFYLDCRAGDEYEAMRLGVGEKLLPIGMIRDKLDELPDDKDADIVCFCKVSLRGYEAALILKEHGWTNVKVMEGGIMAWPYGREL